MAVKGRQSARVVTVFVNDCKDMSLEERTLVVRNLDEEVTKDLLLELFNQAGPVVNVVLRSDFAYIEFEHKISVGYALALLEGIHVFGRQLSLEPKVRNDLLCYEYVTQMSRFNEVMTQNPDFFTRFMPFQRPAETRPHPHYRHESRQWTDESTRSRGHSEDRPVYGDRRQSHPDRRRYQDWNPRRHSDHYYDRSFR